MNVKRRLKNIGIYTGIIYTTLIIIFVFNLVSFNKQQYNIEQEHIYKITQTIDGAILKKDVEETKSILEELVASQAVEVTVDDSKTIIFNSIPHTLGQEHYNSLNENAVIVDSSTSLKTPVGIRNVWYAIYSLSDADLFSQYFMKQTIVMILAFLVLALSIGYLGIYVILPLKKIRDSIQHVSEFDFSKIKPGDDAINLEFYEFADRLEDKIHAATKQYSELEIALQIERERLNNTLTISRSYIHDFKTPMHQVMLENDFYLSKLENPSKEIVELTNINNALIDKLLKDVNEVLLLMNNEAYIKVQDTESIDLYEFIYEILKNTKNQIDSRGLLISVVTDELEPIHVNKATLRLLIHNLITNIINYAKQNSSVNIELNNKKNDVELIFINEAELSNIKRMKDSEKMFNTILQPNGNDYEYSSGNGLFLIKDLVHLMKGQYYFETIDNLVKIIIILPKEIGDESE